MPDRLAYPETIPAEFRYRSAIDLVDTLRRLSIDWTVGRIDLRADRRELTAPFRAEVVARRYAERLRSLTVVQR